jgi:FkbM family methyltransferase
MSSKGNPLDWIVQPLRACIRALQTQRTQVNAAGKLARAILLVPVFGTLLVILRVASRLGLRFSHIAPAPRGLRFECHPPDLVQMYIWLFGLWEPDLTSVVLRRLREGGGFIDVGANIGYFSCLASRVVGAQGTVVSIEASPEVFGQLARSVEANGCSIRLLNKAASDRPGTLDVYAGPSHNIGLTTTVQGRGFARQATVEAQPLDDMLTDAELRGTTLVKIDVEGGEVSVLAGMRRLATQGARNLEILVEVSPLWWNDASTTPRQVLQPLLDAGFHVYVMTNSYWPWRYLWPNDVRRPHRLRDLSILDQRRKRFDLLLSREDADAL